MERSPLTLGLVVLLASLAGEGRAGEPVRLHVWGLTASEGRYGWYGIIEAFEKRYPDVKVIIGPSDRGEDLQKLLCGVVGNSPPDVFRREAMLFGDIAARDILMPLDGFVEADKAEPEGLHEEDYPPGVWASGRLKGRLYAIAENSNPILLAYNKDAFREAGLDPEKPPRTWTEWIEVTKKLTRFDERGHITRLGCVIHNRDDLSFYLRQQGLDVFSEDGRTCRLDSPEGVRAMRHLQAMYEAMGGRDSYDRFAAVTIPNENYDPFLAGDIAMAVEDDWVIQRATSNKTKADIGVAPVPVPEGMPSITVSSTHPLFMMPVNARHPKEAWDFIRFANSPEGQVIYADAQHAYVVAKVGKKMYSGFRPNRKVQAAVAAKYAPKEPPASVAYAEASRILETLQPPPVSPVSGVLKDETRRAVEHVAYGKKAPEVALAEAGRRIQNQLDLFYAREKLPPLQWGVVWLLLALAVVAVVAYVAFSTRHERAHSRMQRRENLMGLVFVGPWVIGFLVFTAGPMVFSIAISFADYDVIHSARYVGLHNYTALLRQDPLFLKSLWNTAFMVLALPVSMAASLGIALLLNTKVKAMGVYRTLFYLPAVTPMVATAVLWYALLNPNGIVNGAIGATFGEWLGFNPPAWLQDPMWSKPALILMGLWGAGGGMILWLAGLQGIPQQLYEAAEIDGAGPLRRFWSITLPMLTPYIFFSLIVGVIGVFQIFSQALVLTSGGPADSTLFYVYYLFNNAFRYFKMGYASAMAWILFVLVLVLTIVQWRVSKRWVHYE